VKITNAIFVAILFFATGVAAQQNAPLAAPPCSLLSGPCPGHPPAFGSGLDAGKQILESQGLAKELAVLGDSQWQAKGDLHRTYQFPDAGMDMPYRLYVPTTWDGHSRLPLIVMLHGAGSDENRYLDSHSKHLLHLAEQHGYVLVSPLGYNRFGAYGTPLKLPAVFGQPEAAAKQRAAVTPQDERTLQLSEKDVINVLEIVLNEYPIDQKSMFLMGHSMGAGGTWYLGAKYSQLWRAIAPMSGPFVDESIPGIASSRCLS
jgi:poly(3-hydroxybutyrate) depolymerase